jgi:multidrug efflux pump subunit AcrA (membrane-fusion protein)
MVLIATIAVLGGCAEPPPVPEPTLDPFISMQAEGAWSEGPIAGVPEGWTVALAVVEPTTIARVSFEVPGMVSQVLVKEGDLVRKGQTLGRLSTEDRKAKLATARQLHRSARRAAPNGASQGGPPPPGLEAAARRRLQKVERAVKRNNADRAAVQRAAKREGEEAGRDLAISIATRRNEGGAAGQRARRKASNDKLAFALASELGTRVRNLEDAVNQSRIASPLGGLVVAVNARAGEAWNTRVPEAAFEIVDPGSYVARVTLPARRAARFEENEEAWVELPRHVAGADRLLPVVVHSVSSVDVAMENADGHMTKWREVGFKLPSRLPEALGMGDEVRVAFAP